MDLYDDVIAGGTSTNGEVNTQPASAASSVSNEPPPNHTTPYNNTNGTPSNIPIKRFQLYVGNLTWVRVGVDKVI